MEQEATVFFDQMIHIAIILVTMVVALIAVRLFLRHVEKLQMRHLSKGRVKTLNGILYGMARAIIIFIALTLVLDLFGINTSSVIAAAGIGGIAIAFGAQAIIADIFSGFFLLMDGQMEVGDWVVLDGGYEGEVQSIGLRRTVIAAYSGALYTFPNAKIQIVSNYQRRNIRCDIEAELPYTLPSSEIPDLVEAVAQRCREHQELFLEPLRYVGIDRLDTFSYRVHISSATKAGDQWRAQRLLRAWLLEAVEAKMKGLNHRIGSDSAAQRLSKEER